MLNDSVREELKPQISARLKPISFEMKAAAPVAVKSNQQISTTDAPNFVEPTLPTSEIAAKHTSPTLIDFQHRNETFPEWRLKLQNAVRQRQSHEQTDTIISDMPPVRQTRLATSGANALKAEIIEETAPVVAPHKNPTLNSALERIEKSRQQFLAEEKPEAAPISPAPATRKNYPFHIAAKLPEVALKPAVVPATVNQPIKPKLAPSLRLDSEPLNTNKLPPLPTAVKSSPGFAQRLMNSFVGETKTEEKAVKPIEISENIEPQIEEIDDCAPFSMRFNAGLFDLIIGSFATLILLSPFILTGENWLSFGGFFTFLAVCAVIMFGYMTIAVGYFGKTIGMRLFSLELIDIEGEEYPTMHQAAVSSAVYLLSLALGGIGFLTIPFNEEKRAAHDLISKTIVVKEF